MVPRPYNDPIPRSNNNAAGTNNKDNPLLSQLCSDYSWELYNAHWVR